MTTCACPANGQQYRVIGWQRIDLGSKFFLLHAAQKENIGLNEEGVFQDNLPRERIIRLEGFMAQKGFRSIKIGCSLCPAHTG